MLRWTANLLTLRASPLAHHLANGGWGLDRLLSVRRSLVAVHCRPARAGDVPDVGRAGVDGGDFGRVHVDADTCTERSRT